MPVRLACDRCHGQKLRCVKGHGQPSCNRCLTTGTACRYSQSMRGVRPQRREVSLANPNLLSCLDTSPGNPTPTGDSSSLWHLSLPLEPLPAPEVSSQQFGPSPADLDILHYPFGVDDSLDPNPGSLIGMPHGSPSPPSPPSPSCTLLPLPDDAVLGLEQRVNQLSQRLLEHAAKYPPPSLWHQSQQNEPAQYPPDVDFPIDETLSLTELAVDVAKRFVDLLRQLRQCPGPYAAVTYATIAPPGLSSSPTIGLASLYNLLSCQNRVLDVWALIFVHVHNCVRLSQRTFANSSQSVPIRVSKLQIGSFSPSISTSLHIQLILMLRGTTELREISSALVREISLPCSKAGSQSLTSDQAALHDESPGSPADGIRGPLAISACRQLLERASTTVKNAKDAKKVIDSVVERADGNIVAA